MLHGQTLYGQTLLLETTETTQGQRSTKLELKVIYDNILSSEPASVDDSYEHADYQLGPKTCVPSGTLECSTVTYTSFFNGIVRSHLSNMVDGIFSDGFDCLLGIV